MTKTQLRVKRVGTCLKIQRTIDALLDGDNSVYSVRDKQTTINKLYEKQRNLNVAMLVLGEIVFDGKDVTTVYKGYSDNPVAIKLAMAVLKKSREERGVTTSS